MAAELFLYSNVYENHPKVQEAYEETDLHLDAVFSIGFSDFAYGRFIDTEKCRSTAVQAEAENVCTLRNLSSFIQICALSSVLKRPLFSV